jgi:hypothetical protein
MKSLFRALPFVFLLLGLVSTGARGQGVGEVTLHGGMARGDGSGGLPTRVTTGGSLAFTRGSFALGPELQFSSGSGRRLVAWGGVARFTLASGSVRPYLVGGLGSYSWKQTNAATLTAFSGSLGAGIMLGDPGGHVTYQAELRVHDKLQNVGAPGSFRLIGATLGIRYRW